MPALCPSHGLKPEPGCCGPEEEKIELFDIPYVDEDCPYYPVCEFCQH